MRNNETASVGLTPMVLGGLWLLLVVLSIGFQIGEAALVDPDEGRNSVIAQEMASKGDFLLPYLDGLPFLDKPFLYFASVAGSIRLFGSSEFSVRLPSLLATLLTLALITWFSSHLFGRSTSWIAGLAFATAPLTAAYARIVIFDATLSLFTTAALIAFYLAIESQPEAGDGDQDWSSPRRWTVTAWLAMALGVFTKGPVALLVPLLVAIPYSLWRRRLRAVLWPGGWLLHLALVIPWLAVVEYKVPGFLRYALVTETWQRVTTDSMQRTGPIWYFLPILLGGASPWILLVAGRGLRFWRETLKRESGNARPVLFLWLWVTLPLLFFSLSQSKRAGYVLPLIPALALLATVALASPPSNRRAVRVAASGLILFALLLFASGVRLVPISGLAPEHAADVFAGALLLGITCLVAGLVAFFVAERTHAATVALSLPLALLPLTAGPVIPTIDESRSLRAVARSLAPLMTDNTQLVGIETFSPSLSFYLQKPTLVATSTGVPFTSNSALAYYDSWLSADQGTLRPPEAWRRLVSECSKPTFVIIRENYQDRRLELQALGLPLAAESRRHSIFGPCQPSPTEQSMAVDPPPLQAEEPPG